MKQTLAIECPAEILVSLHMNAEGLADFMKEQTCFALFRNGQMSSGTAASWLGMPRVSFLMRVMQAGAVLLKDSQNDSQRETSLFSNQPGNES